MFDASSDRFFVYYIPICGGFCAPTVNQDKTCWRHFSNEYTLPLSARFMKIAPYVEHSILCRTCGKTGTKCADRHRKRFSGVGVFVNAIALGLSIVAAVGSTTLDRDTLKATAWVYAEGKPTAGQLDTVRMWVSVQKSVIRIEHPTKPRFQKEELLLDGFEEVSQDVFEIQTAWGGGMCSGSTYMRKTCDECHSKQFAVSSLILSVISQFPTIATSLQRSTRFGDVNCQKTAGVLSNMLSFSTSFAAIMSFHHACYTVMPETVGPVKLEWRLGVGFFCVLTAILIKVVDVIFHALVPTPPQRWQPPDMDMEDLADYLSLAPPVCEEMQLCLESTMTTL
eukprot:TRINITY_DN19889_c0_g3_i1.p1 TRINITY_DN19889_c0_g3~~TRINITY_DN19889_c0_g3_i1.p1  ORF type:complete len:338 (+),score=37.41 TRINITY_DN19889_c0_g3_i1:35-1048(+)